MLALVGMILGSTSSLVWGREECSAALILLWYPRDWWLELFRWAELTAVVRSCCVHLLCTSCTHYQCLTLALVVVSVYLCLPCWKRIIEIFCLFSLGREEVVSTFASMFWFREKDRLGYWSVALPNLGPHLGTLKEGWDLIDPSTVCTQILLWYLSSHISFNFPGIVTSQLSCNNSRYRWAFD